MRVEQAIYGQTRRGHALRLASDLGPVPAELTSRLDLPDTAPPGVEWSPYLSGFPQGDRFVIARTFLDSSATRSGFVVSHALIAPLDEMIETADMRPLLALLIDAPRPLDDTLETLTVPASIGSTPRADDLVQTVESLTTRGRGPVVRVGVHGFEELVVALWFYLWPELRARFAFRLSFGPQDLIDTPKPSLVCTPVALVQRWAKYRTVGTVAAATTSHVVAVLSGEAPFRPLSDFSHEIGAQLEDVSDLALLDRAYELYSAREPSLDDAIATIRLVERLSPNPTVGIVGKTRLLGRLVSHLPTATVHEIRLLRNLGAASLPDAHPLWMGIETWMATNRFSADDDESLLAAIDDALSPATAVEAWRQAILSGLSAAADTVSSSFPAAFWRWARIRPATLSNVARLLRHHDLEHDLCEIAPLEIEREVGGVIMAIALANGWLRLHGTAAGASLPPYDAIRVQLSVDTDSTNFDGVRAALKRTAEAQVITFALELAEPRVLDIAAEGAARQPQLLGGIQITDLQAQALWLCTLTKNPEAWQGPTDPRQSFISVIQNLLDGNPVNHQLISALALTPVANLVSYPRYPEVWERVDEPARTNLLSATAAGWLNLAVTDGVIYPPDTHLESALLTGSRLDSDLQKLASTAIERVVSIVSVLPNYDEARFLRLLDRVFAARHSLSIGSAEAIGSVILDRHWQRAVQHLIHLVKTGRGDLKPSLRICHRIIGILTRWMMDLSPISEDEKWKALEDLATDLYPSGPDHDELWDRAGGKGADLRSGNNGQTRWHGAIAQIRRGKKPSAAKLIEEMKRDFPWNDQIRYLARSIDFGDGSQSKRKD